MSVLEQVCNSDGCPQCWAEDALSFTSGQIEVELEQRFTTDPRILAVGVPETQELDKIVRSGRRETQYIARLVLLEPHECGKSGGPVVRYGGVRPAEPYIHPDDLAEDLATPEEP